VKVGLSRIATSIKYASLFHYYYYYTIKQSREKNGTFLRKAATNMISVLTRIWKQAARLAPSLVLQLSKPCAFCKCLSPMLHAYTYWTCGKNNLPQNRSRILCSSRTGWIEISSKHSNQRHRTL